MENVSVIRPVVAAEVECTCLQAGMWQLKLSIHRCTAYDTPFYREFVKHRDPTYIHYEMIWSYARTG